MEWLRLQNSLVFSFPVGFPRVFVGFPRVFVGFCCLSLSKETWQFCIFTEQIPTALTLAHSKVIWIFVGLPQNIERGKQRLHQMLEEFSGVRAPTDGLLFIVPREFQGQLAMVACNLPTLGWQYLSFIAVACAFCSAIQYPSLLFGMKFFLFLRCLTSSRWVSWFEASWSFFHPLFQLIPFHPFDKANGPDVSPTGSSQGVVPWSRKWPMIGSALEAVGSQLW